MTEICEITIENVDGVIAVNPTLGENGKGTEDNVQLVRFYLLDCIGRKFLHYGFKGVEYKVAVTDANVASASIYSVEEGLISLQGHHIGTT